MEINQAVLEAKKINEEKYIDVNKNMKIGIMGGTFDPIHYAHLATAEFIKNKYKLDKIFFIPSGNPPHKSNEITDKYDRYNMVLLSTMNNADFKVLDIEIKNENKTYTIDTLRKLKDYYPKVEFYFITGADAICDIESWKDVKENFRLTNFIAATRPGISILTVQEKIERLRNKYNANIYTVYVPSLDISSTYIREQINLNQSVRYLISDNVIDYIKDKKLYMNREE